MKKATNNDRDHVVDILTQSFRHNPSVNYIVRQDTRTEERIRALMDYSFSVCLAFGKIWLSDEGRSCALILYPHNKRTSLKAIWLDIILVTKAIGLSGIAKALKRESTIKKKRLTSRMAYLWFIGVIPLYQGKGEGSRLLTEILNDSLLEKLPVFLETSVVKNLDWYQHFGFRVYETAEFGQTLYFLNNLVN